MSKTIKEIADELGVSKTTIRNKMTADFREKWVQTSTANGVQTLIITEEGINALKSMVKGENHTANLGANFTRNQFAPSEDFKTELKAKNEQIEKLQKLLDQSQQLLLSEQKKSQLLIEGKAEIASTNWVSEKEKLEKQVTLYQTTTSREANKTARENERWAIRAEKAFCLVAVLAGIFFVLLLILGWLFFKINYKK